jgi:hypothetical protein
MPLRLAKLAPGSGPREADLRGALKNTDPIDPNRKLPAQVPASGQPAPPEAEASSVATGDIGSASDEQLSQAMDVLRGLALLTSRPAP